MNPIKPFLAIVAASCLAAPFVVAFANAPTRAHDTLSTFTDLMPYPNAEPSPAEDMATLVMIPEVKVEAPKRGKPVSKPPSVPVQKCHLHKLEQGGSPDHPFVLVCETSLPSDLSPVL